ncbi:hypothetical protein FRX31_025653 [Thalictrum thalictroides]|uniref:FAR1 domain-containing protein n=1 Tax=Thalictrum thalictroides TaxID=46969 RepID=A0A7J6VJ45_THATH|nr:hypothetical protein FRX31_025653 [Thalictrum thalictroides]
MENNTFEFDGLGEEYIKQNEMDDIIDINNDEENEIVVEENISDLVEGKMFDSSEDLFNYYVRYGNENGFLVKRRSSKKGDDGEVRWVMFACARFGKSKSNSRNAFKVRPISKTNFNAKVDVVLCSDGRWRAADGKSVGIEFDQTQDCITIKDPTDGLVGVELGGTQESTTTKGYHYPFWNGRDTSSGGM